MDMYGRVVDTGPSKYILISCAPSLVFDEVHRLLKNISGLSSLPLLALLRSFSMNSFSLTKFVISSTIRLEFRSSPLCQDNLNFGWKWNGDARISSKSSSWLLNCELIPVIKASTSASRKNRFLSFVFFRFCTQKDGNVPTAKWVSHFPQLSFDDYYLSQKGAAALERWKKRSRCRSRYINSDGAALPLLLHRKGFALGAHAPSSGAEPTSP